MYPSASCATELDATRGAWTLPCPEHDLRWSWALPGTGPLANFKAFNVEDNVLNQHCLLRSPHAAEVIASEKGAGAPIMRYRA